MSGSTSPTANGIEVDLHPGIAHVGNARQGLVVRQSEVSVTFLAPDRPMDALEGRGTVGGNRSTISKWTPESKA